MNDAAAADLYLASLPPTGDALLAALNRLRDVDPLYWSEKSRCWIVTGHAEVTEGFSGTLPLSSHHLPENLGRVVSMEEMQRRMPNLYRYIPNILPNLDGAQHARIRKLLVKAFNRKLVENLRPYVRERVEMLLDKAQAARDVEFYEDIARQLPAAVILRLLGMSESYLPQLRNWTNATTLALTTFDPKIEWLDELETQLEDMFGVFRREIEERRANPRGDLITELVHAVDEGDRLTVDEMLGSLQLIIVAGHDTTVNSITLGARAISSQPALWAEWREHPERGVDLAIELMRYVAMSTALPRIAAADFDWRGRAIRKGDLVMIMIAGGNRDPKVYAHANELDTRRANDLALTFGPGLHHCIGHLLAKMQVSEFFGAMTRRFDRIEILREPEFLENLVFRGVKALEVRLHPRSVQ
jgi:pimeloyl-[acyl-carrier protein] synthase